MDSELSSTSDEEDQLKNVDDDDDLKAAAQSESDDLCDEHLPDICVHCEECKDLIAIQYLRAHRGYHHALTTLGYKCHKIPDSLSALLKRRNSLTKNWKNLVVVNAKASRELQKIDDAYGLLKSYLDGTHDKCFIGRRQFDLESQAVGLSCSASCILATGICWSQNPRWKNTMEDTRVFQDYFGNDVAKCFFAIFDGHNGRFAADVAANDLHHYLLKEMIHFDPLTLCMCTVNLADVNDLSEYPIERPKPIVRKDSINHIFHKGSANVPQQIMHTCPDPDQLGREDSQVPESKDRKHCHEHRKQQEMKKSDIRDRSAQDPYSTKMKKALKRAFVLTDQALSFGVQEESRVRWSGCSALVCMVRDAGKEADSKEDLDQANSEKVCEVRQDWPPTYLGDIYIANAGNVHAVLSRAGQVHQLTRDHSPANPTEKERLLKAGVSIHAGGRHGKANGILEATRGLGNHGDPLLKSAILCEPYTVSAKIDQYAEFLILASNGLWEVLTNEEAVEVVRSGIKLERHDEDSQADRTEDVGITKSIGPDDCEMTIPGKGTTDAQIEHQSEESRANLYRLVRCRNELSEVRTGDQDEAKGERCHNHLELTDPSTENGNLTGDFTKLAVDEDERLIDDAMALKKSATGEGGIAESTVLAVEVASGGNVASHGNDFERMVSSLANAGSGNETDIDTLKKAHSDYTKSHPCAGQSSEAQVRCLAEKVSERLVQAAILAGARDNITAMLVLLPGCDLDGE